MRKHYTNYYVLHFFHLIMQLRNFSVSLQLEVLHFFWMVVLYSIARINYTIFNQSSPDRHLFQIFCYHKQ